LKGRRFSRTIDATDETNDDLRRESMTMMLSQIEVSRSPDAVFSYVTDPSHFAEWQEGVIEGHVEGRSDVVGATCVTMRRIGGGERAATSKITEIDPPRSWAVRGVDGPIRANVKVTVEPLDGSSRSRVTIALDFEGHGIGKLLVPLVVRRRARKEMPANLTRLKQQLESREERRPAP
jgi:uncharacterized protein YndB with AHSA1/START domain